MREYFVYILTNQYNTTFYIGVTNNLNRRMLEHKNELVEGFSKKYKLKKLVYYESCPDIKDALGREKQLKNWHRWRKMNLIRSVNPELNDLGDAETSSA